MLGLMSVVSCQNKDQDCVVVMHPRLQINNLILQVAQDLHNYKY